MTQEFALFSTAQMFLTTAKILNRLSAVMEHVQLIPLEEAASHQQKTSAVLVMQKWSNILMLALWFL